MLGLVGGPLIIASGVAIIFGAYDNGDSVNSLLSLPEIAWELSLTVYLIVKGFRPSPILAPDAAV
jgi:gamma-glutamyltranspeptidase